MPSKLEGTTSMELPLNEPRNRCIWVSSDNAGRGILGHHSQPGELPVPVEAGVAIAGKAIKLPDEKIQPCRRNLVPFWCSKVFLGHFGAPSLLGIWHDMLLSSMLLTTGDAVCATQAWINAICRLKGSEAIPIPSHLNLTSQTYPSVTELEGP